MTFIYTVVNIRTQVQLQAVISGSFAAYTWTPPTDLNNANALTPVTIPLQKNIPTGEVQVPDVSVQGVK